MNKKVAILVGSLRKDSYNLKLAKALQQLAPAELSTQLVKIDDLPFYNEDIDHDSPPQSYQRLRQAIAAVDGFILVSPEYNRSVPAVLKNALDVGSRPYGQNVWAKKPAMVITASTGSIGGFGANHHLRQSLVFLDVPTMQQPEAYFGNVAEAFDEQGQLAEKSQAFLSSLIKAYHDWLLKLTAN